MKTMKFGDNIRRVSDNDAFTMEKQGWEYCSKQLWKDNVRVLAPVKEEKKSKGEKNLKGKAKKD